MSTETVLLVESMVCGLILRVVAVGVEMGEQLKLLRALQRDKARGFSDRVPPRNSAAWRRWGMPKFRKTLSSSIVPESGEAGSFWQNANDEGYGT